MEQISDRNELSNGESGKRRIWQDEGPDTPEPATGRRNLIPAWNFHSDVTIMRILCQLWLRSKNFPISAYSTFFRHGFLNFKGQTPCQNVLRSGLWNWNTIQSEVCPWSECQAVRGMEIFRRSQHVSFVTHLRHVARILACEENLAVGSPERA